MEQPLISVIIPVYKVEAYLDRCLQSVTGQTYRNLEILLVDDGSPDRSGAICDAWAERDSRVKVIHQKNGGGGAARNAALDVARGELIGFIDSDDYVSPEFYSYLHELISSGADIAECGYLETSGDQAEFAADGSAVTCATPQEAMLGNIQDTVFRQLIWNKLYRRETVEKVRFPVGTTIDDEYFTYRVLGNAKKLVRSDRVLYAYRQQAGSVMHLPYSMKRLNGIRAKVERLEYLRQRMPELEQEAKRELLMSCLYGMQGALDSLSGKALQEARALLHSTANSLGQMELDGVPRKRKILLQLARTHLEETARFLNFLIRIHILT